MGHQITYSEYKRRVFNTALLEAIRMPLLEALTGDGRVYYPITESAAAVKAINAVKMLESASMPDLKSNGAAEAAPTEPSGEPKKAKENVKPINSCGDNDPERELTEAMCDTYFIEELQLESATITQTKNRLRGANYYIVEACEECEEIADKKTEDAKKDGVTFEDDERIELSPEEHAVLDQLFHSKGPGPQIDQIRDATVKALMAEEKSAKEVRDALDLAQSKVAEGDTKAYSETADRINRVGPHSLMGSIMNSMGRAAVKDVNESGMAIDIGTILSENADLIKTRATALYAIMETGNQLEITNFSGKDVERLASNIFYQK